MNPGEFRISLHHIDPPRLTYVTADGEAVVDLSPTEHAAALAVVRSVLVRLDAEDKG